MTYKVEINVSGVWLPATHKYFKERNKARNFERRFNNFNFPTLPQKTRVREVGKSKEINDFFDQWDNVM